MKFDNTPILDAQGHSIAEAVYGYWDGTFHDDIPATESNPELALAFLIWVSHMLGTNHNICYSEWTDRQIYEYMKSEYCKFAPYQAPQENKKSWFKRLRGE